MAYYETYEQETLLLYESETKLWDVYSCVPKHIKKLLKTYENDMFSSIEYDLEGLPISARIKLKKLPKFSTFS